jgi:uncharacterized protein with HEPN domain/predicted nucleotidyltransferase
VSARIPVDRRKIAEFCRRHHIRRLKLFGSVLRDDFRPDSDVDVLVEFEPGHPVGLRIVEMERELAGLLEGTGRTSSPRSISTGGFGTACSPLRSSSMEKSDAVYAGHMLDMARKASGKVSGLSRDEYDRNEDLRLALAHLIQITGEAARHVSPEFQRAHPAIPWVNVVGMRHKVVYDYLHVDYDIVWDVATLDLPPLIDELEKIV